MERTRFPEAEHFVPKDEMTQNIAISAGEAAILRLPGLEEWSRATLRRTPTRIYDINGKLLFLDFPVARGNTVVGSVRAAASKVLGPPVFSRQVGPAGWNYGAALEKLTPIVRQAHPNWKINNTKLVCYSYPKLGVMFTMTDEAGRSQRLIFDVADLSPIPEGEPRPDTEGAVAWSFYDSLADGERERRLEHYAQFDRARAELGPEVRDILIKDPNIGRISVEIDKIIHFYASRELQFCSHYAYTAARSHHCFSLHGQQTSDYCAVATCQMILCYYRYYYTQDQIAPALGYTAGSGCPSDQSAGYESLSCDHIDATYDPSPTFAEACAQIDAIHPFKSGIAHHARACAGYSYSYLLTAIQQHLYIYDPWPNNVDYSAGGAIVWEDWSAVTHTNCVYTQLKYP